jgi:hypothetical protein
VILDLLFWLPIKVARCLLHPVTSMLEDLSNSADDIADEIDSVITQYEIDHGLYQLSLWE